MENHECKQTRSPQKNEWIQSISMVITELGTEVKVSCTQRELGSERVDTLRQTASLAAQEEITQSSGCVEAGGLLSLFLVVPPFLFP